MSTITCQIHLIVYLFQDFKVYFEQSSFLYFDNDSAKYIIVNPMCHEPTKHIEIDCYVIKNKIKLKKCVIHMLSISITKQILNIYTKAFNPHSFKNICLNFVLSIFDPQLARGLKIYEYEISKTNINYIIIFCVFMTKSNYYQFCYFIFYDKIKVKYFYLFFLYLATHIITHIIYCIYLTLYFCF